MKPDLMAIAKGMTSGYLPMGGVLVSDESRMCCTKGWRVLPWLHLFRPSGLLRRGHSQSDHHQARRTGRPRPRSDRPLFPRALESVGDHPMVGQARMKGMFGALELVPDENDLKKRFDDVGKVGTITRDHSFANGLVMRAVRDSLIISPPLTITEEETDVLIASARKTLDAAWNDVRKQGLA
jgi:putrescine aminotransferase